jgi:hypothetical protein
MAKLQWGRVRMKMESSIAAEMSVVTEELQWAALLQTRK